MKRELVKVKNLANRIVSVPHSPSQDYILSPFSESGKKCLCFFSGDCLKNRRLFKILLFSSQVCCNITLLFHKFMYVTMNIH